VIDAPNAADRAERIAQIHGRALAEKDGAVHRRSERRPV
jgi:hypothetical protein